MTDQFFDADGFVTRYRIEHSGPKVVLIHGVGSSLESWDDVVPVLAPHFQILRYDLRGLGESTKVHARYELGDFVSDFAALMQHIGWPSCHVVGHSLGGLIAQGIALTHPTLVDKLVLSSTVAGRNAEEIARVQERLSTVAGGIAGDHFRKSMDRWFTPAFRATHPERIARLEARNLTNDPVCYAAAYRVLAETDLADELHRIKAETLVVTGEHDIGSNPRMAALMHEHIAGSKLMI